MKVQFLERDAVAIEACVRCLKDTSFQNDPVLSWLREIEVLQALSSSAYLKVTFWAFRSPDMKKVVSIVLGKKEGQEGWIPYTAFLKMDDGRSLNWDFDINGNLLRV